MPNYRFEILFQIIVSISHVQIVAKSKASFNWEFKEWDYSNGTNNISENFLSKYLVQTHRNVVFWIDIFCLSYSQKHVIHIQ